MCTALCIGVFNKLKTTLFVILAGEQTGEWKATSKWQETSRTCVELLQRQAILWFEGTQGDMTMSCWRNFLKSCSGHVPCELNSVRMLRAVKADLLSYHGWSNEVWVVIMQPGRIHTLSILLLFLHCKYFIYCYIKSNLCPTCKVVFKFFLLKFHLPNIVPST